MPISHVRSQLLLAKRLLSVNELANPMAGSVSPPPFDGHAGDLLQMLRERLMQINAPRPTNQIGWDRSTVAWLQLPSYAPVPSRSRFDWWIETGRSSRIIDGIHRRWIRSSGSVAIESCGTLRCSLPPLRWSPGPSLSLSLSLSWRRRVVTVPGRQGAPFTNQCSSETLC